MEQSWDKVPDPVAVQVRVRVHSLVGLRACNHRTFAYTVAPWHAVRPLSDFAAAVGMPHAGWRPDDDVAAAAEVAR